MSVPFVVLPRLSVVFAAILNTLAALPVIWYSEASVPEDMVKALLAVIACCNVTVWPVPGSIISRPLKVTGLVPDIFWLLVVNELVPVPEVNVPLLVKPPWNSISSLISLLQTPLIVTKPLNTFVPVVLSSKWRVASIVLVPSMVIFNSRILELLFTIRFPWTVNTPPKAAFALKLP